MVKTLRRSNVMKDYSNYRNISLLNSGYKLYTILLKIKL
jgi:hypothetical protein